MPNSLKFDAVPVDFFTALKARVEAKLKPGEYFNEDVLNATTAVAAEMLAQTALYQKNIVSSSSNPFIAKGDALNIAGSFVGIQERLTAMNAYCILSIERDPAFPQKILPSGTEFSLDGVIFSTNEDLPTDKSEVKATAKDEGFLNIYPSSAVMTDNNISFEKNADVLFFTDGRSNENDEEFRQRVLLAFRNPAFYPNKGGYVNILKGIFAGMRECNVIYENNTVYFYPLFQKTQFPPYGIPDNATLEEVRKQIALFSTFGLEQYFVIAPEAEVIDITISGLTPDTAEIRSQITERAKGYFNALQNPGTPYIGTDLQRTVYRADFSSINDLTPSSLIYPKNPAQFFVFGKISFINA